MPNEQQHYVPRFLLKNFAHGKKPKIYAYDKSNDNIFHTNIKNVSAESGFYDLEIKDAVITLEPSLSKLETNTAVVIKKLLSHKYIKSLDEKSIAILAAFLAVQFVRTKEQRLRFEHLGKLLADKLRRMGATEENIRNEIGDLESANQSKLFGLKIILDAKEYVPHFLNKAWALFETTHAHPFFISDNPIALQNSVDHGPFGNLGLAVRGIEIYLPISTTLTLALMCPSIAMEFHNGYKQIAALESKTPGLVDAHIKNKQSIVEFYEGLISGNPITLSQEHVMRLNSLQVMYSSRFVYCERSSFELVKDMIVHSAKHREGLKPTLS